MGDRSKRLDTRPRSSPSHLDDACNLNRCLVLVQHLSRPGITVTGDYRDTESKLRLPTAEPGLWTTDLSAGTSSHNSQSLRPGWVLSSHQIPLDTVSLRVLVLMQRRYSQEGGGPVWGH